MEEKIEEIIKKLRSISTEIGKLPRASNSETEDHLDGASSSVQDAIEELEEIIDSL